MCSQKWLIVIGVLGLGGEGWVDTCNCYTLACLDSFDLRRLSPESTFNSLSMGGMGRPVGTRKICFSSLIWALGAC